MTVKTKSIFNLSDKIKNNLGDKEVQSTNSASKWDIPESEILKDGGTSWRGRKRRMFMKFYVIPLVDSGKKINVDNLIQNFLLDYFAFFKVHTLKKEDFFNSRNEIKDKKINQFLSIVNNVLAENKLTIQDCKLKIK